MAVSYIDTCYLIALIDPTDKVRKDSSIGRGKAESVVGNIKSVRVPLPAYSEAIFKAGEYHQDDKETRMQLFSELDRLTNKGFIEVGYLNDPDALKLASDIARESLDMRDQMSAMDSLIIATAGSDPECPPRSSSNSSSP